MTVWHQQKRWVFFFDLGPLQDPCDDDDDDHDGDDGDNHDNDLYDGLVVHRASPGDQGPLVGRVVQSERSSLFTESSPSS